MSQIERLLGHDSKAIVRAPGVHVSGLVKDIYTTNKPVFIYRLFKAVIECLSADLIMLNAGSSLLDFGYLGMELKDLGLYRLFNKSVITTFQGCDVRMCEICPVRTFLGNSVCKNVPSGMNYAECDDRKRRRLNKLLKVSKKIYGITPDLCRSDDNITYAPHIKCIDGVADDSKVKRSARKVIRIGHMPKRYHKGTEYIEGIVSILKKQYGEKIEYVPIRGMPWSDALSLLSTCDLFIDQVLIGWYGGISVEAALLGIPSICYIDKKLFRFVTQDISSHLPVISLEHHEELFDKINKYLTCSDLIEVESERCRENAKRIHDPIELVKKILM